MDKNGKKHQVNEERLHHRLPCGSLSNPTPVMFVSHSLMKSGTLVTAGRNVSVKKKTGWVRLNAMIKMDAMKMPSAS